GGAGGRRAGLRLPQDGKFGQKLTIDADERHYRRACGGCGRCATARRSRRAVVLASIELALAVCRYACVAPVESRRAGLLVLAYGRARGFTNTRRHRLLERR